MIKIREFCFITLLVGILLFSNAIESRAGAENGEFLGYKIGAKSPITKTTKLFSSPFEEMSWGYYIEAEKPTKPDDFGNVYLLVTQKSYTILAITASTFFTTEKNRTAFHDKYVRILSAQYPGSYRGNWNDSLGQIRSGWSFGEPKQPGFDIEVAMAKHHLNAPFSGNYPVHVSLTYRSRRDLYNQAISERDQRLREDVGKGGQNRGL